MRNYSYSFIPINLNLLGSFVIVHRYACGFGFVDTFSFVSSSDF